MIVCEIFNNIYIRNFGFFLINLNFLVNLIKDNLNFKVFFLNLFKVLKKKNIVGITSLEDEK